MLSDANKVNRIGHQAFAQQSVSSLNASLSFTHITDLFFIVVNVGLTMKEKLSMRMHGKYQIIIV